jgi:transmembrane sensor
MRSEHIRNEERACRAEQAADWFIRLREDEITESVLAQWFAWCEDPENLSEFHAVGLLWRESVQVDIDRRFTAESVLDPREDGRPNSPSNWRKYALSCVSRPGYWIGVGCAVLFLAGWPYVRSHISPQTRGRPQTANLAAESVVHASEMPDGTQLVLAPHTSVAIDFSGSRRSLVMSGGEAFFKVHPDKQKPFVVAAGGLTVTAVGTAFDVRSEADKVVVVVQEGVVAVTGTNTPTARGESWRIASGYQMIFDATSRTSTVSAVDPERALAWRSGRLEYLSENLGTVIADVSRYTSYRIELGDPRLAKMKYTGTVDTAAVKDWLNGLQTAFPIRAVIVQDGHYVLFNRSGEH